MLTNIRLKQVSINENLTKQWFRTVNKTNLTCPNSSVKAEVFALAGVFEYSSYISESCKRYEVVRKVRMLLWTGGKQFESKK